MAGGTHVLVRQLTTQDARELWALMRRNWEYLLEYWDDLNMQFPTEWSLRHRIDEPKVEPRQWLFGIRDAYSGVLVGYAELTELDRHTGAVEIGYWLGEEFQGHGYMTEAVRALAHFALTELEFDEVLAWVEPPNVGSKKVLRRAGFNEEGPDRKRGGHWEWFSYRLPMAAA